MTEQIKDAKMAAIVAYMTIIGTFIAMSINHDIKNEFASFHIRQALGLNLVLIGLGYFIGYFNSDMITAAFYLFYIILWVYGFTGVLQGELRTIPILGKHFQSWFKNL